MSCDAKHPNLLHTYCSSPYGLSERSHGPFHWMSYHAGNEQKRIEWTVTQAELDLVQIEKEANR